MVPADPPGLYAPERRALLLATVRREGRVSVATASAQWGVTPETIRRDLVDLERRGLVRRVHGGAIALDPDDAVTASVGGGARYVSLCANPSVDTTSTLTRALAVGEVNRVRATSMQAGGKGVNVTQVFHLAGRDAVVILPARPADPFLALLNEAGTPHLAIPVDVDVRTNWTLADDAGVTTKINAPGPVLSPSDVDRLARSLLHATAQARWVVLSGSLPPGVPAHWYATLSDHCRRRGLHVAVDASGEALDAVLSAPGELPTLVSPNLEEFAQHCGTDPLVWRAQVRDGHLGELRHECERLIGRGVDTVLVTLAAQGALLVNAHGAWHASTPPVPVASTVGAGDSALAGLVMALDDGAPSAQALRQAVAYGAAAVALPGSTLPRFVDVDAVDVRPL